MAVTAKAQGMVFVTMWIAAQQPVANVLECDCCCCCPCCSFLSLSARGFETCSIMLEGQMEHQDSAGNKVGRDLKCVVQGSTIHGVCKGRGTSTLARK